MGDIGRGLEARGAESVHGVGAGCVGEAGCQGGGAELVGGLAIVDLEVCNELVRLGLRHLYVEIVGTYIAQGKVLNQAGVNATALLDLLEEGVYEVFEAGILQAALASLCEGCADGESNDDIVGVLRLTIKPHRLVTKSIFIAPAGRQAAQAQGQLTCCSARTRGSGA